MKTGPCAKTNTKCTIIAVNGQHFVGSNYCLNPQKECPRDKGEDYKKCKSICQQKGHAEEVAVSLAGKQAKNGKAFLEGHSYYCMNCQHVLFNAGIKSLHIGAPDATT